MKQIYKHCRALIKFKRDYLQAISALTCILACKRLLAPRNLQAVSSQLAPVQGVPVCG